ncbi:MAG: acyl carrier protein [Candidatus Dadabacteria bacterium]|nr:acyl carrier protein [Candidatus Dadabacteria bacterium]NIQ13996.1 acyl carrier protein [Candidatus Dadabacteria bacterium]
MDRKYLIEKLRKLIVKKLELDINPGNIEPDESLIELGLGVDSVSTLEFILALENEFDVEIDESDINLGILSTVNNIANYINDLKKSF